MQDSELHQAARANDPIKIKKLLDTMHDPRIVESTFHCMPIHQAAWFGCILAMKAFYQHDTTLINAKTTVGEWTPLHQAAANNQADTVYWLLEHDADTTLKTTDGKTAQQLAIEKSHSHITAILFKHEMMKALETVTQVEEESNKNVEPSNIALSIVPRKRPEKETILINIPNGLHIHNIPEDNNCLFHAIDFCIPNSKGPMVLRLLAVDYMRKNIEYFRNFIVPDEDEDDEEWETTHEQYVDFYLKQMLLPETWGDQPEIIALQEILKCAIIVINANGMAPVIPSDANDRKIYPSDPIFILFDDRPPEHYNALLPIKDHDSRRILENLIMPSSSTTFSKVYLQPFSFSSTSHPLINIKPAEKQLCQPLENHNAIKQALIKSLPQNSSLQLGVSNSTDSFFDSLAQVFNENNAYNQYTAKSLRQLCDKYVKELDKSNPNHWVKQALERNGQSYNEYKVRIQFTPEEIEKSEVGKLLNTTIDGIPYIEGRIIVREILKKRLHVIECYGKSELEFGHQLIDDVPSFVKPSLINYEDEELFHIVCYDGHFVPLLKHTPAHKQESTDNEKYSSLPSSYNLFYTLPQFLNSPPKTSKKNGEEDEVNKLANPFEK